MVLGKRERPMLKTFITDRPRALTAESAHINNSVGSGDHRKFPKEKNQKKSKLLNFRKNSNFN